MKLGRLCEKVTVAPGMGQPGWAKSDMWAQKLRLLQDVVFIDLVQGWVALFSSGRERYIGEQKAKLAGLSAFDRLLAAGNELH